MAKSDRPALDSLRTLIEERETEALCSRATRSSQSVRRLPEKRLETDYRQPFAVDVDRILHSLAYSRYIDKTQVFYLIRNDHITHRMLHVQLASKIARTIGRFLSLNEDLIEAIAIGHDIGHAPFGHDGEKFLSALCQKHGIGEYHHNVQSVHFLEQVERKGRGWNLSLQTLDGILCHDGEVHDQEIAPYREKTFADHDQQLEQKRMGGGGVLVPMTLEGCVVRFSDTISYIGRDIEDAIRLGLIKRSDLPDECVKLLGNTNGSIVYSLVTDVIRNSYGRDYIAFSPDISDALKRLKQFNYASIYANPRIKSDIGRIEALFAYMFDRFLDDIGAENQDSPIYRNFITGMAGEYRENQSPAEIVRDFIAGMTDQYFLTLAPDSMRPAIKSFPGAMAEDAKNG